MCSSPQDPGGARRTRAKCAVPAAPGEPRPLSSDLGTERERRADNVSRQPVQAYVAHELGRRAGIARGQRRRVDLWWRSEAVRQPEATETTIAEASRRHAPRPSPPRPRTLAPQDD